MRRQDLSFRRIKIDTASVSGVSAREFISQIANSTMSLGNVGRKMMTDEESCKTSVVGVNIPNKNANPIIRFCGRRINESAQLINKK